MGTLYSYRKGWGVIFVFQCNLDIFTEGALHCVREGHAMGGSPPIVTRNVPLSADTQRDVLRLCQPCQPPTSKALSTSKRQKATYSKKIL